MGWEGRDEGMADGDGAGKAFSCLRQGTACTVRGAGLSDGRPVSVDTCWRYETDGWRGATSR